MTNKQICAIIFLFYLTVHPSLAAKVKQILQLNNFVNCHDSDNVSVPISCESFVLTASGPKIFINGNISIKSDLPKQLNVKTVLCIPRNIFILKSSVQFQLEIVSNRCQIRGEKCHKESNDTLMSVCKMITSANPMTSKVKPNFACPIKKYIYNYIIKFFTKYSIEMTLILILYLFKRSIHDHRWNFQYGAHFNASHT